jgi:hypothetical protein
MTKVESPMILRSRIERELGIYKPCKVTRASASSLVACILSLRIKDTSFCPLKIKDGHPLPLDTCHPVFYAIVSKLNNFV